MASFEQAVGVVLDHEGGLTDDAHDAGGVTNHGITLPVLRQEGAAGDVDHDGDVDVQDIRALTPMMAKRIYRAQWWDRYGYERIADQALATKVFDMAVNMGPWQAHLIAQRALRACGVAVKEDGVLGAVTLGALNAAPTEALLAAMRSEAAGVYRMILVRHPDYAGFAKGWLRRAYE